MSVSVVIPCLDRWGFTKQCLDALTANTDPVEVILVDNGSTDQTMIAAPSRCDIYIRNRENLGFARACNQGRALATGDVVVFLNNDTEVQTGWLPPLVAALEHADIAGSRLIYPDGRIQHAGVEVDFSKPPGQEAWNITTERPSGPVTAVTGACMAVSADSWGGFDEAFVNGYEDVDACLKASVWYCADSTVIHHESQSDPAARFGHAAQNIALLRSRQVVTS